MTRRLPLLLALLLSSTAILGTACGDPDETGGGGGAATAEVTFHEDIEPLLQQHCLSCHRAGQIGGFSLETFEEAAPMASALAGYTASRVMPPFLAQETDACAPRFPWRDDLRLTDEEIALFAAWSAEGAPEGDPAAAPPPYVPPAPGLPGADLTLKAKAPTTVGGSEDVFTCVVYDPELAGPTWFDGIHFVAGNTTIDHHAIVGRLPRAELPAGALEAGGYDCFGAPGKMLTAWIPGGVPLELPEGAAFQLDESDVIVVQMHYHPNGSEETDQSSVELRSHLAEPTWEYRSFLWGNAKNAQEGLAPGPDDTGAPAFLIPAGAKGHTETMSLTLPTALKTQVPILSVGTHMHYIGTSMRIEVTRGAPSEAQPAEECLLETPAWDFGWQRLYLYDADFASLPTLTGGDTLTLTCAYDNTLENPGVKQALDEQGLTMPVDIPMGETTLNEMCIGLFGFVVPVGTPQF